MSESSKKRVLKDVIENFIELYSTKVFLEEAANAVEEIASVALSPTAQMRLDKISSDLSDLAESLEDLPEEEEDWYGW